ncbi:hypothetical protein H257_01597 [Aphanomyces astaci]|uniref:Uncharacterized protein n=1 Tax=Aphanomyces astaci TaxID=112090 RepID=W4HAL0_APHAT|nr:hypothetical protein H257_01597 [Aphanomyces astaci]ETV88324.1 hypothetical protein H257_01597 [Aphanomyces astaci]|eukprot:XP_009823187.1 hypothetical protein H257_01597 [Aphanomyces astaci]
MSFVRSIVRQFSGESSIETVQQKEDYERHQRLELLKAQKDLRQANAMYRGGGSSLQDELVRRSATVQRGDRLHHDSFEWVSRSRESSFEVVSRNGSFDLCEEPDAEPYVVVVNSPSTPEQACKELEDQNVAASDATSLFVQRLVADMIEAAVAQCLVSRVVKAAAVDYSDRWIAAGTRSSARRSTLAIQLVRSSTKAALDSVARMQLEREAMVAEDCTVSLMQKRRYPSRVNTPVESADMEVKCRHAALATEALAAFYAARAQKKLVRSEANRGAEALKLREMATPSSSWAKVLQLIDNPEDHASFASMQPPVARMFSVLRTSAA